ncbi:hypothetical protein JCM10207_004442 [Rhodosporidiobolus poonsookiae]
MPSYFCHECQYEGSDFPTNASSPCCPRCQSAFVEEIPPEDVEGVDDPRDFDPDDAEGGEAGIGEGVDPFAALFGGGGAQGAGAAAGAQGGQGAPFFRFALPGGNVEFFATGGAGGGGAAGAAGMGVGGPPGLNPLTTAMLQAFGMAPPAQAFAPPPGPQRAGGGGDDAADPEEVGLGGDGAGQQGQRGEGQRQQVPIMNLAHFLGEAFGGRTPHPADHADNNPFAEGGHEHGADEEDAAQEQQQAGAGQVPLNGGLGFLGQLLNSLGVGIGGGFGMPGQAGDYVFGEANFQQLLNDLMEQAAGRAGPQPAPDDMIEKLPRIQITQDLLDHDTITTCAVCQDAFALSDETIALPCKHLFHTDCLTPWLKNSGTCPTCRYALVPQPGQEGYGQAPAQGQAGEGEAAQGQGGEGQTQPAAEGAGQSSTSAGAEASTSTSSPARPSLPSRQSTLPSIDGGSALPGSWVWPAAGSSPQEADEAGDGVAPMDVDEPNASGSMSGGGAVGAGRMAADAAERRARAARERQELAEPEIEDVD